MRWVRKKLKKCFTAPQIALAHSERSGNLLDENVAGYARPHLVGGKSAAIPRAARSLLENRRNEVFFSVVSLWEIGVKGALERPDFRLDPRALREGLIAAGFVEIQLTAEHILALNHLPPLHRDPFDRMLLCQASVESLIMLTNDDRLVQYPLPVRRL